MAQPNKLLILLNCLNIGLIRLCNLALTDTSLGLVDPSTSHPSLSSRTFTPSSLTHSHVSNDVYLLHNADTGHACALDPSYIPGSTNFTHIKFGECVAGLVTQIASYLEEVSVQKFGKAKGRWVI